MKVSVLVPTFRRPQSLSNCLQALQAQTRAAYEILVVRQECDDETRRCLAARGALLPPVREIAVTQSGQVAALNAGIAAMRGDAGAITDDDACPRPDWLEQIAAHFDRDPRIGAVGGRDWVPQASGLEQCEKTIVGRVQWCGRVIGNHHLGVGEAREVDVLKGANMSFRAAAIKNIHFDERLRGAGAQVHNDMAFSLAVQRTGWKLIYDPAVAVDHFAAERPSGQGRDGRDMTAQRDAVHNETLILLEYLPPARRAAFLAFSFFVGTRAAPGLAQGIRLAAARHPHIYALWAATQAGRRTGWRRRRCGHDL